MAKQTVAVESIESLEKEVREQANHLRELVFKNDIRDLKDVSQIKKTRIAIARLKTRISALQKKG
ncbi:MAG: 50S ribosomal protein L29 [Candidatus Margulisiibacteriota bacterium]